MQTERKNLGIPLKDRSEADIREQLGAESEDVVAAAVRLHAYAVAGKLGVSALWQQIWMGGGMLSQFFNHTYAGDYGAVAGRIEKFFWRLEQKAQYGGVREYVHTQIAQALGNLFEKVRVIRRIQWVESPEQVGKSRTAEQYTHENNSGRTVLVEIPAGSRGGFSNFMWALAEALGIPYSVKLAEKRIRIRNALQCCDLLILDEAHNVYDWTDREIADFFGYLRTDLFANGDRGVCLLATNCDAMGRLQSFRRRSGYNVGQIIGRMRNEVMQIDPSEDIVEADVRALVKRYYEPGAATLRRLHAIATREKLGHFGLLLDIVNEAWSRAKARKQPMSDVMVDAVAEETMMRLKSRKEMFE